MNIFQTDIDRVAIHRKYGIVGVRKTGEKLRHAYRTRLTFAEEEKDALSCVDELVLSMTLGEHSYAVMMDDLARLQEFQISSTDVHYFRDYSAGRKQLELQLQQLHEERIARERFPTVRAAYEQYQLCLKMVGSY